MFYIHVCIFQHTYSYKCIALFHVHITPRRNPQYYVHINLLNIYIWIKSTIFPDLESVQLRLRLCWSNGCDGSAGLIKWYDICFAVVFIYLYTCGVFVFLSLCFYNAISERYAEIASTFTARAQARMVVSWWEIQTFVIAYMVGLERLLCIHHI